MFNALSVMCVTVMAFFICVYDTVHILYFNIYLLSLWKSYYYYYYYYYSIYV